MNDHVIWDFYLPKKSGHMIHKVLYFNNNPYDYILQAP